MRKLRRDKNMECGIYLLEFSCIGIKNFSHTFIISFCFCFFVLDQCLSR